MRQHLAMRHVCVVYVDAIGRMPSMAELSMVAHVSERRLRDAFGDTMGVPPIKYFRYRLLTVARERLLTGCRECVSVSYVLWTSALVISAGLPPATRSCSASSPRRRFTWCIAAPSDQVAPSSRVIGPFPGSQVVPESTASVMSL